MSRLAPVIPIANNETEILMVQAPYPGVSKFVGRPTSLLAACSKISPQIMSKLGYIDRQWIDVEVVDRVRQLCRNGRVRVVCISTSTAAIQQAASIARAVRETSGGSVLVIAGGPHEDDCQEKIANRMSELFDISIGGEAEYALAALLSNYFAADFTPATFIRELDALDLSAVPRRFSIARRDQSQARNYSGPASALTSFGAIPSIAEAAHFDCFEASRAIQLMLTRGCPYGQCTFCAEPNNRYQSDSSYDWISDVIEANPGAALYFQDSVMPNTREIRERLLPLLAEARVEWGCQLFLPMSSTGYIEAPFQHSGIRSLEFT